MLKPADFVVREICFHDRGQNGVYSCVKTDTRQSKLCFLKI